MKSIYTHVDYLVLEDHWLKAKDKRDEFRDKEQKALDAGRKVSAAVYRWVAGRWENRMLKLVDIVNLRLQNACNQVEES